MLKPIAVTLLLVILFTRSVEAQVIYDPLLNLICHDNIIYPTPTAQGKQVYSEDPWDSACREFEACVDAGVEASVCQLRIAAAELEVCGSDTLCQAEAFTYAAGVNAVFSPGVFIVLSNEDTAAALRQGLLYLENGAPIEASTAFMQHNSEVPMLMLSAAAALRAAALHDQAIELIARAQDFLPGNTLINYLAAVILGENGESRRAAHLAYTLSQILIDDPVLEPLAAALWSRYPLDLTQFEPWSLYQIYATAGSPTGRGYADLHQQPPISVRVQYDDDGSLTLLDYPFRELLLGAHPEAYVAYFPSSESTVEYRMVDLGVSLRWHSIDAGYLITEQSWGSEVNLTTELLLVPQGSADPFNDLSPIDCGLLHWFSAGQTVESSWMWPANRLSIFDAPNGVEIASVYRVMLLDETRCEDTTLWWKVRLQDADGGGTGWMPINNGTQIRLRVDSGLNAPTIILNSAASALNTSPAGADRARRAGRRRAG